MNRRTALSRCLCAIVPGALAPLAYVRAAQGTPPAREQRLALVIGNGDYRFSPLKNPVNVAKAMSEVLRQLGFTVDQQQNAGRRSMLEAIRRFVLRSKSYGVRVFYYAGHGVQVDGKNYLIPVDADIRSEADIATQGADVTEMLERLGQNTGGMNIVILDACRNNPFDEGATIADEGRRLRFRGTAVAGLAPQDAPTGTLVAFATAPGAVAIDGPGAEHSLYTKHLLANLDTPGLPVEQLFKRVRLAVTQETRRQQVPWESSSLMGDFCFAAVAGACRYEGAAR
jgi:uncharacterized caspase-like protein